MFEFYHACAKPSAVSASDDQVAKSGGALESPFERAKLPMIIAAVAMVAGLAIAGSLDRTPPRAGDPAPSVPFGGAIVLAAWVLGIGALHRLGRAGSMDRSENRSRPVDPPKPAADEDDLDAEPMPERPAGHDDADDDDDDDDEPKTDAKTGD
jgi:hypothetical protein